MTREELTEKMKDLSNPPSRVHLIQQVWEIMNDENEQLNKEIVKLKDETKRIIEYLLDYPYHAREKDFMQHIKETEDFLKELKND